MDREQGMAARQLNKKTLNDNPSVMNSRNEAFGLVYFEAMARGCIIITSRKEGFDGIIQDGVNGFLFKASDSN